MGGASIENRKKCATEVSMRNVSGCKYFFFLLYTVLGSIANPYNIFYLDLQITFKTSYYH